MITQTYDLNMIPGGVPVRVAASQRDTGSRTIVFNLFNGSETFAPSNAYARVDGTRADGEVFTTTAALSGSTATWVMSLDMTAAAGEGKAELVIVDTSGNVLGSKNFVIDIEPYTKDPDADPTTEEITIWEQMYNQSVVQAAAAQTSANAAASSASASETSATNAANSASAAASSAASAAAAVSEAVTQATAAAEQKITDVIDAADETPTEGSDNIVQSGGVYSRLTTAKTLWTASEIASVSTLTLDGETEGFELAEYDALAIIACYGTSDSPNPQNTTIAFLASDVSYVNTIAVRTVSSCSRTTTIDKTANTITFGRCYTSSSSSTGALCIPYKIIGLKFGITALS